MPDNIHASAVVLDDRGVLIAGPSGSGKTALALALIGQFTAARRFASLVADDQLFVRAAAGRLIVAAPPAIEGLVEVRGLGPRSARHRQSAVVDLVVRLVAEVDSPRLAEPATETISGIVLPRLDLPALNIMSSALAVTAWLRAPPFR